MDNLNEVPLVPYRILKVDALTVNIYESANEVALAGSAIARQILHDAIARHGKATAIFATGRSQKQFLAHLTEQNDQPHAQPPLDWSRIIGFHLDEYLGIAADHPASFRHYLKTYLTSQVAIAQWHDIEGDGLLPLKICQDYEKALRANPADLCCLGVGNNGHLAFNDPAVADFNDSHWIKLVRLDAQNRQQQAASSAFDGIDSVPQYAFTLTLSAIRAAQHSLCLAQGKDKADIVCKMLTGLIHPNCPASVLRNMPQAILLLDRAAAHLIS